MKAKKCDRCGKLYEEYYTPRIYEYSGPTFGFGRFKVKADTVSLSLEGEANQYTADLCLDCMRDFESFWNLRVMPDEER